MKKSIYIAYTGGTIGMQRSDHGYVPMAGFMEDCLARMPEFHRPEMPITISTNMPLIDSSDMTPADWQRIAEDIRGNYDKYDGFVILHGTDTMSFTASALSFMLEDLHKPVIITGSPDPLAELRSDGQQNLLNAPLYRGQLPDPRGDALLQQSALSRQPQQEGACRRLPRLRLAQLPALLNAGIAISLEAGELGVPCDRPLVLRHHPSPSGW